MYDLNQAATAIKAIFDLMTPEYTDTDNALNDAAFTILDALYQGDHASTEAMAAALYKAGVSVELIGDFLDISADLVAEYTGQPVPA